MGTTGFLKLQGNLFSPEQLKNGDLVEAHINQHFAHMHGVLQNLEKDLIEQIKKQRHIFIQNVESLKQKLNSQEEILQNGLLMANSVKDSLAEINLMSVIKDLESITNVPCHLVKEPINSNQRLRFEADKSVIEVLKTHCKLTIPDLVPLTLTDNNNLPADYVSEPLAPLQIPSLWDNIIEISPTSPTTLSAATSLTSLQSQQIDPLILEHGSKRLIEVTHINDPSCFYVQQLSLRNDLIELNRALTEYALKTKAPTEIVLDTLYIGKYHDSWFRCRAKKFYKDGHGKEFCQVFYIDYGNVESVSINNMRNISPQFTTQSPFALKCRLDIEPKEGTWSKEAINRMNNLVCSKDQTNLELVMTINEIVDNEYIVDIAKNGIEKLMSLKDHLLFLGCATYSSTGYLRKINPTAVRRFFHQDLKLSTFTAVACIHIESPDNIFVVKANKQATNYELMKIDMKKEYKKGKSKKWLINSPYVGMPCAVLHSDFYWYRAVICEIPCIQTVEVFYVDMGIKCMQNFSKIRKLQQKYMVYETQAIHISLKDVAPLPSNGSKWNSATKDFLELHLKDVKVRVVPFYENENNSFYNSYSVCLYTIDNVNISSLLVAANLAVSTGTSSHNSLKAEENTTENSVRKRKILNGLSSVSVSSRAEKNIDEMDPFKMRIIISNPVSPDCIYVADPTRENVNNVLHDEMQDFYNKNVAISELEMQKDQMCAVYSRKDKAFYRARILDYKPEVEYVVLLIDLGIEETVPLDDVQPLNTKFLSYPRYQFKVKLADITAPGGSSSWPSSSCQKLQDLIYDNETCKFFISKVGETTNDVIPVELWVKLSINTGPVAPTKIEMKSISRMLVETGYAIPVKGYLQDVQKTLAIDVKNQLSKSEQSSECLKGVKWLTKLKEEDTLVNSDNSLKSDNLSDLSMDSDIEDDDDVSSDSIPMPPEKCQWIAAEPIKHDFFTAVTTYVDNDCYVYLHSKDDSQETLKLIESELNKRYSKRTIKPYDKFWEKGDICIAKYHYDNKWYRAQVKDIISDQVVQVQFVDYGNVEECNIGTLKKRIILHEIPIQCTKCAIYGLYPNTPKETWATKDLDKIHSLLVDKTCEVTVLNTSETLPNILPIRITIMAPHCDFITYLTEYEKMNIQNPNASYAESDLSASLITQEIREDHYQRDNDYEHADVFIEGFLKDCEIYGPIAINSDSEFPELTKEPKNLKTRKEEKKEEVASSMDSVSWNDIANQENRMITSTPQVESNTSKCEEKANNSIEGNNSFSSVYSSESISTNSYQDISHYIKDGDLIHMFITMVNKKAFKNMRFEFFGHLTRGNKKIQSFLEEYKKMDEEIQTTAEGQPIIDKPSIDMPCYALYTDEKWYRGLITKYQTDPITGKFSVSIKYVDFGNSSVVDISNLRKIHEKWMDLPMMAVNCTFYNFKPVQDISKTKLAVTVAQIYDQKPLFAILKNRTSSVLIVDLFFDKECTESALVPLIEEGFFQKKSEDCL